MSRCVSLTLVFFFSLSFLSLSPVLPLLKKKKRKKKERVLLNLSLKKTEKLCVFPTTGPDVSEQFGAGIGEPRAVGRIPPALPGFVHPPR